MMTDFKREVRFEPGYNYLHETGPKRRGQHGMSIRFLLIGELGAAQFLMGTGWTPLGQVDVDAPGREPVHVDYWQAMVSPFGDHKFGTVNTPSGHDLGQHWATPIYDGQPDQPCDILPGGVCYYDGSGLAADEVLRDFIAEGEDAVWRHLEAHYEYLADPANSEHE